MGEMSEQKKEERRKQDRTQTKAAKDLESEEQREERRKQHREHAKAAMGEMSEEKKEERRKQDREHTKGHSVLSRLKKFKDRVRWGPSYPCITCHQTLYSHQMLEYDHQLEDLLKNQTSDYVFQNALSIPESFYRIIDNNNVPKWFFSR